MVFTNRCGCATDAHAVLVFNAASSAAPLPQATFHQAGRRWGTWVPIAAQIINAATQHAPQRDGSSPRSCVPLHTARLAGRAR